MPADTTDDASGPSGADLADPTNAEAADEQRVIRERVTRLAFGGDPRGFDEPHVRLDYVFTPSAYADRVTACEVRRTPDVARRASDHFPLLVELRT